MTAPFVVDAPMNGEIFLTYLEQCLVPVLSGRARSSAWTIFPPTKSAGVREMIEATGAMLWLRCHPIPQTSTQSNSPFAKLKAQLRKAGEKNIQSPRSGIGSER